MPPTPRQPDGKTAERPLRLSGRWRWAAAGILGVAAGLAVVTARLANATSYLSNSPAACINCHVMTDAYASWQRGSHGHVAVCTDCHVPHRNAVAEYAYKATDGAKHAFMFTFDLTPQVIRLSERARPVVQTNCIRCHADRMAMVRLATASERPCWSCHTGVHGDVHSLSASPAELRPPLPPAGLKTTRERKRP